MTACRMRTIPAGRALSGILAVARVLMAGCVALGYGLAKQAASETATAGIATAGGRIDPKRAEGRVVIDRIGDL